MSAADCYHPRGDQPVFAERPAAVDRQADAGHEIVFGQEQHGVGDVLRPAGALKQRAFHGPLADAFGQMSSGISTGPGRTALTRTRGASSTANMRVSVGIEPFETKYAL